MNAFITDPGSYCRLTAGSVKSAGSVLPYELASNDGNEAIAMIAPLWTSITSPVAPWARFIS